MHIRESENAYKLTRVGMSVYLDLQWQMHYHEAGSVNNEYVHILIRMSRSRIHQTRMANKSIKRSISHEIIYVGPTPKPIYFAWTKSVNSITRNYKIWFLRILEHLKKTKKSQKWLAGKKMATKFYWKWDFGIKKNERWKSRGVGIIWKDELKKIFTKRDMGQLF